MPRVDIYDTTLRDGAQGEGITFSLEDQIAVVQRLDSLGVDYVEGGQPGSNPKAVEFFREIRKIKLERTQLAAFGGTRSTKNTAEKDPNLLAIVRSEVPVATIVGKTWDLHVRKVLAVSLEDNSSIIEDSIGFLKKEGVKVFFDAEHFFDGIKANEQYALELLKRVEDAGADLIVCCDTNGGSFPADIESGLLRAKETVSLPLGIHTHNDSDLATANSLTGVACGASQVHGTINGYGERSGNADLCVVIPNLVLKMGYQCLQEGSLAELTQLSHYVSELANISPRNDQPFVGRSAFAHKGGWHVHAVEQDTATYEHIDPRSVGNERRLLVSELSGKSSILQKASQLGIELPDGVAQGKELAERLKTLEHQGYQYEGADASLELLLRKATGTHKTFFDLESFRVVVEKREGRLLADATVRVIVDGEEKFMAAEGDGPVNALDRALRKALEEFHPELNEMHLTDFKVRVLDAKAGTAAQVRVLIESSDKTGSWNTVGVSENIIEASWQALVDSIEYKLLRSREL